MEARQHHARRVVEYHQNHIADHLIRCERGEGNDRPFRHTLSTSVDPPRRRLDKNQDFLVETHVPPRPGPLSVKPRMVKPLLRLRRPGGLGSSERSAIGPATARKVLVSPRLPPLVYEGIDRSLAGKRLPAAWFADPPGPKLLGLERSESIQEPSADEAYREEEEEPSASQAEQTQKAKVSVDAVPDEKREEAFDPPLRAKGLYHFPDFRTEWRACEVLAYNPTEEQFLIQWLATGRQKRITSLQLRFDSETEADALRRQTDAELRRDTVEAMMLEEIVIEELSRWQLGSEASAVNGGSGASVKRIMDLAQLKRYEASPQVVQSLIREAAEAYCRSQAKWLLLWRRPDLEEYLGVKPVPISLEPRNDDLESEDPALSLEDVPDEESEDSAGSWWEPPPKERPEPLMPRPRQGLATKGPGGVRGNLLPNRKFKNLSSPTILQKSQELGQLSLLGEKEPQSRLLQVYNLVGSLYCEHVVPLYFPVRKREPYSLAAFARSLVDGFSRSSSFYRISWPESITLFFMTESGIIKDWNPRMSGLVARLMEAGLQHLCLKNLQRLLELFEFYAKLTADCREGRTQLTYMPPPVYLRMASMNYEQHPLFYIQVTVERHASGDKNPEATGANSFIPSLELAIESAFASADTKSLDVILRRKKFNDVVMHMAQRWKLDTAKMDLLPDGAAHGGAPTANNVAALRNTAHMLSQLASGYSTAIPDEALSSDDERPSVDELLMTPPTRRQDIKVLFQDAAGQLEVKLTAHPTEFREVLGDHFRKVVELTEKYSTIDGSLQQDGEVKQQYLASLSSMQKVDQEGYEEQITSCFFDPYEVVYEVHQYQALLQRFSHQEEQLKKMSNMRFDEVAGVAKPEGQGGQGTEKDENGKDEDEVQSQSPHSSFSEERFALGITSSIEELREHLDRIDGWHQELNEAQDLPERHLGLFVVDVTPLRKALMAMCACCRLRLMGVVQRWLEDACAKLKLSLQAKSGEIIMSPKQPDELHSTILAVKSLDPFLVETAPVLASIRQMFEVLESRYHQVPRALVKRWYECIHAVPDLRDRAEKWQNIFRKDLRGKFNIRIAEKAKILSAQVQECRLVLEEYACKVSLTKAEFYYNKMYKLQERVAKLQEQVQKQHVHEEMMEMPLSEFPGLAATAEQIAPLLDLWFLAHDWNQWQDEILFGEFSKIDPNGVKQKLQSCTETMKRLEEVFATQPRPRQVLHSLSLELTELRVLLPVIVSLRNPGLRERHWTLIGEAIDQNIQANQMKEMNLSNMNERFPFVAHLAKIQAISETASKEMLIEEELRRMQENWAKLHFEFKPIGVFGEDEHRVEEESSSLVADLHHAEVWELITEQMAKVRTLGRRPNAAVHEKDLVAHDAKLKIIGELCDRLHEAQYGYVLAREHMLQEGLVKELMQRDTERNKEWKRFFEVEKQWQNIMMHLKSSNTWLQLLEVPKISFFCREAAATMEHIQRSIHDVLDIHRKQVPHLYRLSDAELMRVIRYGHNPAEPAIRACLPGVFALDVGPSVMSEGHAIRGLVGDVGEYLSLPEELAVQEGMQIKDWLPKLISQMSHLLRWSMFGLMLSNFNASDPRVLDEKYPLQVRAAALDLAFTTEVESLLVETTSASLLQTRRLSLCTLIDQIQERRLQAADSEDRGVDFESFVAGSSSEEESVEEEETESEEDEDENEDEEEEEEEEEEPTSDESVESEESDEQPAGGRMAARKAVRLEPPPLAPGGLSSARSSRAEMGGRKKETGAHKLLPEHVQAQVPWQLFRISMASALQQLLRWREIIEQLELERPEGLQGKLALTSYRWLTTLRHYMRSKTATNGEEFQSYVDHGQYTLSMAGFDIGYAWQYLGNVGPAGRMYWDPQTEKGQLIMVHSFATARGVMSCGECRGEAPAYLARQLGIVQEKIFVNWRTSFLSVWRHLEGVMLAKMWLTISLEVSAHVQVLSVLAQELHSHLNACRLNLSTEAPTSWVSLECSQAMLAPQKLPLLLLQAFRPHALATPSLDAICELWLLSSSMRPTTAKAVAPLTAFAWRFCEATQLLSWTSHQRVVHSGHAGRSSQADIGRTPRGSPGLWQLRLLCETTVKITVQVRRSRRLAKGRASSEDNKIDNLRTRPEGGSELPTEPGTSSSFRRPSVVRDRRPSVARERRPSVAREELESERPRRPTVQGALLQDTLAPSWARACLYRAFQLCFLDGDSSDGASELMKLLNVSQDDLRAVNEQIDKVSLEADAKAVLEEMGLTARESQIQALRRMNSWVDQCHSETDYCIGMPPTRAVLVLGPVAVGKSSCIDALSRQAEPWELRRLNTTSLALDACDALQRPVAGSSRLLPPNSSMGILDTGTRLPGKTRKVLVHVDGDLGPLQESFLASLNGMSEPCSAMRQGLQISKQSWLKLPGGVCGNRLAVAFEMGVDGCQSLGPDLVTRCGVVHLMEEDLSAELSSLVQSWCNQAEAHFENANISHTVQCLCKDVLVPLMLLVYGDQIKAGASGLLAEAAQKLTELSSTATVSVSRKTIKKRPVTSKLSQQWALPSMPCRALFLRVQQAFQDIYGHFDKLDHEGRGDGDLEVDDHNRRSRTETMESISQAARSPLNSRSPRASPRASPRGSPRTSRVAARRQDRLEESPEVPSESLGKGRRKSSLKQQVAKKASTLLLLPEVDFPAQEDVVLFDSETTVAFVFATLSSFKALLHDSASGLLEEFTLRLVDLIGPPAAHVRLPVEFSILDSVPDEHLKNFYHVDSILKEPDMADLDSYIFVPTQQSKRFLALNNVLQRSQSPLLLMGPCGSGKSLLLSQMIAQLPLRETPPTLPATYAALCGKVVPTSGFGSRAELLYMGATQWIQPGLWERSLQSLTRSSKTGLRPRLYSWCVFVIDDCHCANESLREAWRFNLERKLVHFPGSAGINQSIRKGFAGKRGPAERLEREATLPSLQHLEGVMMVLAARSLSDMASRHNFLRHTWMYNLEPLQESDILKIVGDNMSHFIFVKDISPSVTSSKMLYVRFLHALQLKLQETQASTRLITPHVLFRFFKSLLSQPTECLCDLKPMEFHKFFLHELLRETVDRLPVHRQKSAIMDVAQLQQSIFGGLDRHGQLRAEGPSDNISEASGASGVEQEQDQLTEICETLHALQYTSLEPVTDMSRPQRVQKNGYGEIEDPNQLCASLRLELQRGWERAKAITSEVSPMLWSLNAWGAPDREQSFQEMLKLRYESKGFERNCAGLEPRHLILSDEYILHVLRLGRLFELAAGASQNKVWGRQGGKVLVLAPSIPVAICVIRGAAHLHGLTFDTPLGRPASEGSDTGTTQGMPVLGLSHEGLIDADQSGYATGLTGAAFRGWIKEKLLNAIQELSLGMVLCIPPAILNHQDNLAVLHEAFAQEGPPPHWYSEREAKECEDAIAALPSEARLLAYLALEDEEGETPATLDVFWAEALGRVQFVLLLSNEVPEERISCGQCTVSTLDTSCPQFLQMAVLHMSPPSVDAYSAAAKVHISSPILDPPETWQPASPFKADLEQATLAEAAAELVRVAHFVAKEPPAGMAPRFIRSTQVPGLGVLDPTLPAHSSAWNGEAVQSGLLPALGGLADVGEILSLAQGLCRFKGQELARQYTRHKDAHNLLEDLQKSAASSNASKLQQQLAEITRRFNEAQEEYEEKKAEHAESQKEFTELLDEVVNRCTQKANAVEAAEELVTKAKSEVESGRFQLLNFSKQDGVELRKAVHQHCTNDERTPILALMELCCMLMRVSSTPTRDEVRTTLSEPNFATKMAATCAVDAETFSEAFVQPMKEAAAVADGMDTMDVKALSVLANVALPACQYTVTVLQLPKLREELRDLEEQREQRRPEVEDMELQTRLLFEDAELRKAKAEELEQEMQRVEVLSTSATSKRSRTLMMTNGLRQDRIRWGWKLQELQRRLQCLVGDALLSAAATELLGTYGPQHREELLEHWKEVLERLSIPHSKDFDLASYWIVPTARYRLHTELALPKDIHLEESLVFACLQTSKWPVFYDPDHLAPGFLQKFFPGAVRLTMGSTDFQKDLLSSLSSRAVTSPSDVSEVLGQVIIIENAYLPAIRDTDILTELVARRQLVAAGLQTAGLVQLSAGVEDTVVHVDPRIVLIFITDMGEPWNHDAMSKNFLMIDFQLTREDGLSGPLMDLMTDTVCAKAMPSVQQELKQLGPEFSQLMAKWYRQDKELIQKLAFHHHESEVEFPTEEQLRETMNLKMNLESVGRKLLKTRDSEVKLQQQRATHDLLVSSLCAMAVAAEEIFNLCPASSIPLSGAWRVCEEFMPEPPPEDRKKSNRDSDYAGMARRAVLAGLWERISPGLPRQFALAAALRLTMASAMPQKPLQEILGTLLLQCPAGDPRVFQHSLNGLLCSAMQAILQGRGLSDALQQYRQVEGAPQNPRASFRTLFEIQGSTGRQSSKKSNGTDSRSGSKTMASVNRSMMSLGNLAFSEMDEESEEEEQEHSASKRRSSTAETAAALRAAGEAQNTSAELMQQLFVANKGHWSHCNSKQIFLARFAYFQETLRCQLEHCIRDEAPEAQSKESVSLPDLFRVNRMELFGIDEKHLEDLLAEAPHRENKDFMARRSTRNLVTPVDEGGENVAEGGADTPQLFSLLLHFGASFGHGACGPWTLQLHVEPQARSLVDRLEDSVNNDPGAWARWAESIATQNYRKGMTGHNALSEHLPLLASLPHELLSSLLPQGPSHVTLKTICGAGFLQTILFSVLASFSLSAVLHASELIVAGATGNATPLRRMSLPRLLEPEGTHRSAVPVVCLCDSEASSVVENIHRIHQAKEEAGRKVIQLSLTDLVANSTTGKAGQSAGERPNCWSSISPAAECASTPSGVLELLEECKDLGYWLLLHVQTSSSCLPSIEHLGLEMPHSSFQLLERIWFTCSTPSFQSTADEKFRLFVIIDCRCPVALPSWLFRCGRSELCVVDSAGTPSLRSWLEEALDAMPRRAQSFLSSMVLPAAPAGKVATGFKTLTDAANASQLAAEGKMGRVMMSPVLCSKLAQPNFPLKLQTSGQRLAMLVLAAACDGGLWPKCILKTRSIGGPRVAEVVEELNFDVMLRSVDMLEIFAPLALQQAHKCPVWPDTSSFPGPSISAILYNLLRQIRQVHLSRQQEIFVAPAESQKNSNAEGVSKRSSASRTSQLNVLASAPRKSRKNIDVQDLDELLWYHDEHFESKDSAWKVFATLVEAMERISNQGEHCGEAEEQQLQEALKMLPLLDPFSIRLAAPCDAIFTMALAFSTTRRGRLKLPELPDHLQEAVTPDVAEGQEERKEMDDVEVDEVQESPLSTKRKVSGVQTLQFQIPSMGQLPSDLGSSSEGDQEESPEVALGRRVVDAHSASRMALVELLKATQVCVEGSEAALPKTPPRPGENESPLQAEWRRQRSCVARWAWDIHAEALALIRGLEGECMSPKMSLKLRHLLHSADLWAARAEPEDTISAPPVSTRLLPNCPIEVFHVAKSHAAATFPVPDGWQPPHFRDEANFGSWLSHLAMQLYQVYVSDSVPRNLHISELAQLEPLLLSLRLCLAGQKNLQVEQTCLVFLPSAPAEDAPESPTSTSSRSEYKAVSEDFSTWDELDTERPPAFKATCKLSQQLAAAMAPLFAEKVEAPRISLADGAGSPGSAGSPSAASATTAGATGATGAGQPDGERKSMSATFTKSVRKVAMMASLSAKPGRRSTVRPGTKKLKEKDPTFVQKEISEEDLVLQGLLADGAVWSTQGLHIDSNVAGVTRLPPLRVVAATLKAAEYMYSQAFPQAVGCMNLFVHRLFGSPWPLPTEGLLPRSSVEMWTVRLPFWSKPQNRWQPVMLLDGMGPSAAPGHLRQWEDDLCDSTIFSRSMEDHLEESLSVARPFGLLPTDSLLSAMAGPPMLSRRKAEKVKKKL